METIDPRKLKALQELAPKVLSNLGAQDVGEMINRIHYITGRNLKDSIQGYKLLRFHKLIPDNLVNELHLEQKYLELVNKPQVIELFDRLGCVLGRVTDYTASLKRQTYNPMDAQQGELTFPAKGVQKTQEPDQKSPVSVQNESKSLLDRLKLDTNF